MKTTIIIIFFVISFEIFGQTGSVEASSADSNNGFYGLIQNGNQNFLINQKGAVRLNKQDVFQSYYRKIYSDSTIQNPNFILQSNNVFSKLPIVPFIYFDGKIFNQKKIKFKKSITVK